MARGYRESDVNNFTDEFREKPIPPRVTGWKPSSTQPRTQRAPFKLEKLQIAGILLIIVFIWCIISAVVIAMFEIDILALTEFEDDGKGDVYGHVTDEEGNYLVNVTIVIHGTHHFTKTNMDGFYSMESIKEGDYEIEASTDGYGSLTKRVSIYAHIPKQVDFMLEEGGYEKTVNERHSSNLSELRFLNLSTAIFIVIYGSLALVGGIFAYFQRFYWLAMTGGISGVVAGVLTIGIILAPIISIIALFLILSNQEEFITSEAPFMDRIFGVRRARPGPGPVPRRAPQKFKGYKPPAKLKASKSRFGAERYERAPPPAPMGEMGYKELGPGEGSAEMAEPTMKCVVCKGAIKSEAQGIVCQCDTWYHKFCADRVSVCRNCGNSLLG